MGPDVCIRQVDSLGNAPQVLYAVIARVPIDVVDDHSFWYLTVGQYPHDSMRQPGLASIREHPVTVFPPVPYRCTFGGNDSRRSRPV